ncbi:MAG: protein kinase domain-containing protein [Hyphomicrobiales bacterium]
MPIGRLGNYEILDRIGQGGFGVVFKARDTRLDRVVALKVLSDAAASSREFRVRLQREARAEASLSHPNIATCFEIGEADLDPASLVQADAPVGGPPRSTLYLALEYVPGEDLATYVRGRRLRLSEILDLAIQIASGLEAAHLGGVVHRDLTARNVLVTNDGRAKILDFGLARLRDSTAPSDTETTSSIASSHGKIMGTLPYLSPEQALGKPVDARTDLFSFGVLLYQMVTGQFPFRGTTHIELLQSLANDEPDPLARYARDVPDELERVVEKLLAKDASDRYQSAHEVLTDLRHLAHGSVPARTRRAHIPSRRKWILWSTAGLLAAAAIAVAIVRWPIDGPSRYASRGIVVLPFVNASGDPRIGYIGMGMAAGILGDLAQGTDLNVVSQSIAWSYASSHKSSAVIARELGVASVLEGTVQAQESAIRIDVQLVDGRTGFAVWSGKFERPREDLADLEGAIVDQVTLVLSARATKGHQLSLDRTRSGLAYDEYLKAGQYLEDADNPRGGDLALASYDRAIALDPKFALAYAGRSRALWKIYNRDREPETLRRAEVAADSALRLEPSLLEAHVARAQIYRGTSRIPESIAELGEVVRLNPHWDEGFLQLARTYEEGGFLDRAEESYRKAVSLRPGYWRTWNNLGGVLIRKGDYTEARAAFRQVIALAPDLNRGYENLAALEILEGHYVEAIRVYERLPVPVTDGTLASNIGTAYFYTGRLAKAEEYYLLAVQVEPHNQIWWENLGDLYRRQGRERDAVTQYRTALRLVDEQMRQDPEGRALRLQRALYLAKAGDHDEALGGIAKLLPALSVTDAETAHSLAKIYVLCGRWDDSIDALRNAIAAGYSPRLIADEDEFRPLRRLPAFVALTRRNAGAG